MKFDFPGMLPEKNDAKLTSRQSTAVKVHFSTGKEATNPAVKEKEPEKGQEKDEAAPVTEQSLTSSPSLTFPVSKCDVIGLLEKGHLLKY